MHGRQVTLPVLALPACIGPSGFSCDGGQDRVLGEQPGHLAVVVYDGVVPPLQLGEELEELLSFGPFGDVRAGSQGVGNGRDGG
jgi:hypothetical protein